MMPIKSPKATKVKCLLAQDGAHVEQGTPLFELYDYEERQILSQLQRALVDNETKRAEVSGLDVATKLEALERICFEREPSVEAAQLKYQALIERHSVGDVALADVAWGRHDIVLKAYQSLVSAVELEVFRRNVADSVKVYENIDILLKEETRYVEAAIARLRIVSPVSGTFRCFVEDGTPVRLGHLLGQLE